MLYKKLKSPPPEINLMEDFYACFLYVRMSCTWQSSISQSALIVWVEIFELLRIRESCPAEMLYLWINWYWLIFFNFNVFQNGSYEIMQVRSLYLHDNHKRAIIELAING